MATPDAVPAATAPPDGPSPRPTPSAAVAGDDREIVISRVVDAPRALVYRAFTDAAHLPHWWGPFGFTTTVHELQARPGSTWRLTMHGPDGTDYPNVIRCQDVEDGRRLLLHHGSGEPGDAGFEVEITFLDEWAGTRVTLRQTHPTAAKAAEIRTPAVDAGEQTMTRLQGYVGTLRERWPAELLEGVEPGTEADDFVLLRVVDAPRELVFRALTETEHLTRWFGPAGMGLRVLSNQLRPAGMLRYAMKPGPEESYGRFVYRRVHAPDQLAYVVSFTDAGGEPIRHPLAATWPLEVLALVTLTAHGERTLLSTRSMPIHADEAERATFRAGHDGMVKGFSGTYVQLDAHLQRPR
ncbi:MAG: SRPBCC domain-containing protein [Deltaproteobacteria bacterium]|nr:SRPBCC domain-containing protein [Deltaproteobacteria bacterium]